MRVPRGITYRPSWPSLSRTTMTNRLSMSEAGRRISILSKGGIGIAIKPALVRLRRRDDRMPARSRVFAGVLIRRAVATQRLATFLTCSQVHPLRPDLYALCALAAGGIFNRG